MRRKGKTGYAFDGYFDLTAYFILSVLFPSISFHIQINQLNTEDMLACYSAVAMGLVFTMTLFYDFYSRCKDCKGKKKSLVRAVLWGRNLFAIVTIVLVGVLFYIFSPDVDVNGTDIQKGMYCLLGLSMYPLGIVLWEVCKRFVKEDKHMVSKARA